MHAHYFPHLPNKMLMLLIILLPLTISVQAQPESAHIEFFTDKNEPALRSISVNNYGVYGISINSAGSYGLSTYGVGVFGNSISESGVSGRSTNGVGIVGSSANGHGALFRAGDGKATIILSGSQYYGGNDDGVIKSSSGQPHGDIGIVSNDEVVIELDDNDDESGRFSIWNGKDVNVFSVNESGTVSATGTFVQGSDRNNKENFIKIEPSQILDAVMKLSIEQWNYQGDSTNHIGPMAQDFHRIFRVGQNDKTIATVDADGVALGAIQGLYTLVIEQGDQISTQKKIIDELLRRISKIEFDLAKK